MTATPRRPQNKEQTRIDHNRNQRMKAVRELDRLLKVAEQLDFVGSVEIVIPGKDGRLGRIKAGLTSYLD